MRGISYTIISAAIVLLSFARAELRAETPGQLPRMLQRLDEKIEQRDNYRAMHEERIDHLKQILHRTPITPEQRYDVHTMLIEAYEAYQFDSTLYYLDRNLELARLTDSRYRTDETLLRLAHLYSTSGYYLEASEILYRKIDTTRLDSDLMSRYYLTFSRFLSETHEYSGDMRTSEEARQKLAYYTRRMLETLPRDSDTHRRYLSEKLIDTGEIDRADAIVDSLLAKEPPTTRNYAIYAYTKSMIEGRRGHADEQIAWLVRSACADLQSATRDNASLCLLSEILFLSFDDIDGAFRYIRISMEDALFYHARLRPWQIASVLPIIEQSYQARQKRQFRIIVGLSIALLGLFLLTAVIAVAETRQKRRLSLMRRELQQTNEQLNDYIRKLSEINEDQQILNDEILKANAVKEEYIGLFLGICSDYIDKLKDFQRTIRRKLATESSSAVQKELGSSKMVDGYVEEFYNTFDNAFLHLYPNFVNEFNSLLRPDAHIEPKKGKLLNTELRIFALIRLGISDSSKIAGLLRYSVNTIYNYRAKVKNNAIGSREDFEEKIKKIGTFQHEN